MNAKVPLSEVTKKTIVLQVFDWDKITKTDGIGEVQILLVMTSTTSIMVNHQPGPDPVVAAQPRNRDQRVEATAQGHRHQWQGGLPRLTMLTIYLSKSFQSFYFGFLTFLLNFLFLFLYFTFQYFLYPATSADHQAVLYGSPWVRNNEMLGIQIRSKIRKRKKERAACHIAHCSG